MKQRFYGAAVKGMQDQMTASPLDARFPLFLGTVYNSRADYTNAIPSLEKAHELSPNKQAILFLLGQTEWAKGDNAKALQYFQQAYELEHAYTDAAIYYAAAAIRAGQSTLASQLLQSLESDDKAADLKIIAAYDAVGQIARAIPIWQAHLKASPDDVQGYFTLAALYYKTGQRALAVQSLKQAEQVNSAVVSQAEQLIKEILSGTATVN
jgi:cytochrome c-type biogenesis protein CcmH/NrfG